MTRYQYVARLLPIRTQLELVDRTHGLVTEWFDEYCFALERKHPDRVAVLLDHDTSQVAGRLDSLLVDRGWLIGAFHLDLDCNAGVIAADCIRVGTPVSVGYDPELTLELGQSGILHRQVGTLNEISVVRKGGAAYRGAQVTHRLDFPQRAKTADSEADEVTWAGPTLRRYFEAQLTLR